MRKRTILFVDDEPNILSGLRRMLRSLRNEMDLHFVGSGKGALEFMASHNVDVIVSDLRMPGMDGTTLLKHVQKRFPHVMRMILSGHADQVAILETVGVAHQFLAKPTSAETIRKILIRTCNLQDVFTNENMKKLITGIGKLPSLPSVYAELQAKLKNPNCSVDEVATIIEKDMAMSAKILQLVNSAFFGFFNSVESPARAVNLLGLDTIKALVLDIGAFTEICETCSTAIKIEELWQHSLGVAVYAKHIAQMEGQDQASCNNAFIAGLLHDIGKLLFHVNAIVSYDKVNEIAVAVPAKCHITDRDMLIMDHAEIGSYLLGLWGLSSQVVEAVAFHHCLQDYSWPAFSPAIAVYAADIINHRMFSGSCFELSEADTNYLAEAGLAGRFAVWEQHCKELTL